MKRKNILTIGIYMCISLSLCLLGCDKKSVEQSGISQDVDIDAFSVLGVEMGGSYGK